MHQVSLTTVVTVITCILDKSVVMIYSKAGMRLVLCCISCKHFVFQCYALSEWSETVKCSDRCTRLESVPATY